MWVWVWAHLPPRAALCFPLAERRHVGLSEELTIVRKVVGVLLVEVVVGQEERGQAEQRGGEVDDGDATLGGGRVRALGVWGCGVVGLWVMGLGLM